MKKLDLLVLAVLTAGALPPSAACKKKGGGDNAGAASDKAAGGDQAPAKPAAPAADKKLAQVGITATLPGDATIDEQKMDAGGFQATISYEGMSNFFIENVGEMASSYDFTVKMAEAKDWKIQEKGADGATWKLEWTSPDMMDPKVMEFGVNVRSKVGDKLIECASNGITEAQATALLQICTTLKP